jgi:hypothetical protein
MALRKRAVPAKLSTTRSRSQLRNSLRERRVSSGCQREHAQRAIASDRTGSRELSEGARLAMALVETCTRD